MSSIIREYLAKSEAILNEVAADSKQLERAAQVIADAYCGGHKIYIFGCTHSAILAEDVFYRAGAPAFWRPLWGPGMSITTTPGLLSSAVEKIETLGNEIIRCSQMEAGDVLLVASNSGKNGAPVAIADAALKRGAKLILITSSNYKDQKGNHSSIPNLWAFADQAVIIDNHVPKGDISIDVEGCGMGPLSTMAGSFIMHTVSALSIEKIIAAGITPPVFLSSNTPSGLEHNQKLMDDPKLRGNFLMP